MNRDQVILYDSAEAAQLVTIPVWRDSQGRVHADEHSARFHGATHQKCECGAVIEARGYCRPCHDRRTRERWLAMPLVEFGEAMCEADGDRFFFDEDDFYEWCEENEIKPSAVMLVDCNPVSFREVEPDYWQDELPDEGELPGDIQDALDALNAVIRAHERPACWIPGSNRIVMPDREIAQEAP